MIMGDMRRWITLAEGQRRTVRVYHGSTERTLRLEPAPLYGVRDFGFAASYGLERASSAGDAFVHTLDFAFANLCDADALEHLFATHDITPWPSAAGVFIDHPEFMHILIEAGYDGLTASDFGFRSDFEEKQVYMVVNAKRQVTWRDVVAVSSDDLRHEHAPD